MLLTLLLNLAYLGLLVLAAPWLVYACWFRGKYREGWNAKWLGRLPVTPGQRPRIWLHAVSVGEVNVLAPLLQRIAEQYPHVDCVLTTTTKTGYDLARRKYPSLAAVCYCPLDFSWAVREALRRIGPRLLVLTELELWPNLIRLAAAEQVAVAVVNGRLSERSWRGYRKLRPLLKRLLGKLSWVGVQTEEYAARFRDLGLPLERLTITGSMKFDGAETCRDNPRTVALAALTGWDAEDVVFLAGSTQAPEERMAVNAFRRLSGRFPRLKLILVPRHPERFDEVARLLDESGLPWRRRTRLPGSASGRSESGSVTPPAILLVDTIGELGAWWGLARIAFVGGSLGSRGGQNMIEPAAYGAAVAFGPETRNFRDVVELLLKHRAATVVHDQAELDSFVERCLEDPAWAAAQGTAARELVQGQLGATDRTLAGLAAWLPVCQAAVTQDSAAH